MPRRRLRDLSIVQNTTNLEETNSEQKTTIGSSNVPNTPDELAETQTRNANLLPINYDSWHQMLDSNKNEALNNIKERFALEVSDNYVKKELGKKWRDHKSTLKKEYFKKNELSSGQKVGGLQLFNIKHKKKDGSPMTFEGMVGFDFKDLLLTQPDILDPTHSNTCLRGVRLKLKFKGEGASGEAEVQRKYEELQLKLKAEAAVREAEVAAREAEQSRKYDTLQLQLQNMMKMFQQLQNLPY
ncbi:mov10b.1: Putative helicase mov-10-B.1 [Gossypium arboreum]|uniref:Mov10b.1: Putative helicase mov-10-B.1 n=1 Tax=Gossypium arboreum TaxID=29729 RepID=A0A0B0N0D1_GOSAR|nr:mov10b.1: Putative helicase mov-10-B.1 [Gossypium arboreum]